MSKGAETKERIARAALALFVSKGVAETTTKDIAAKAEISEGGIYRYFPSKEDLAWDLFREHYVALGEALEKAQMRHETIQGKARAIVDCYCQRADEDWMLFSYHLLTLHQQLPRLNNVKPNPVDVVEGVLNSAMAEGDIPVRPVKVLAAMALGVVLQTAFHKIYGRIDVPLSDHAELLFEGVWQVIQGGEEK